MSGTTPLFQGSRFFWGLLEYGRAHTHTHTPGHVCANATASTPHLDPRLCRLVSSRSRQASLLLLCLLCREKMARKEAERGKEREKERQRENGREEDRHRDRCVEGGKWDSGGHPHARGGAVGAPGDCLGGAHRKRVCFVCACVLWVDTVEGGLLVQSGKSWFLFYIQSEFLLNYFLFSKNQGLLSYFTVILSLNKFMC